MCAFIATFIFLSHLVGAALHDISSATIAQPTTGISGSAAMFSVVVNRNVAPIQCVSFFVYGTQSSITQYYLVGQVSAPNHVFEQFLVYTIYFDSSLFMDGKVM